MSGAVLGFIAARARLGLSRAAAVSGSVLSTALDGAPGGANSNPTNKGPGDAFVRRFSSIFGGHAQSTNEILMVSPTAFEYNSAAAQDNHFMEAVVEAERLSARETVLREHGASPNTEQNPPLPPSPLTSTSGSPATRFLRPL